MKTASVMCSLLVLALGLSSVRAPDAAPERGSTYQNICIPRAILTDWEPMDESTVLFWTSTESHPYLVIIAEPIANLLLAGDIYVFDGDKDGMICGNGKDRLVAGGLPGGMQRIIAIAPLSDEWSAGLQRFLSPGRREIAACDKDADQGARGPVC